MPRRPPSRGFTLLEVMMAAAIVGVLSTVAIPLVSRMTLRTKTTERTYMMRAVHDALEDVYRVNGRFPPDPGTDLVAASLNPPGPITNMRRAFDPALDSWALLTNNLRIEGNLYYSYSFVAQETGSPFALLEAVGDLDGDGVLSYKFVQYNRVNGTYQWASSDPADGRDDDLTYGSF